MRADPSKLAHYRAVNAWEPLSDPRVRNDARCRIVLHMNWKAQTLPMLLTGLQPNVKEDGQIPVPHDQTALPQPSTQEIVRCSPLAQVKRGLYTTPTFLVHGTADELIPWQQSQRMWQELTSRGVIAHLELIPGRPHICDTSRDPGSPDWVAVMRGYNFLARAVQLN
jgi:acetyl esterase/lipase